MGITVGIPSGVCGTLLQLKDYLRAAAAASRFDHGLYMASAIGFSTHET